MLGARPKGDPAAGCYGEQEKHVKQKTSVADVVQKEESPFWEEITQSPIWEAYEAAISAALNKPQSGEVSDSLVKE